MDDKENFVGDYQPLSNTSFVPSSIDGVDDEIGELQLHDDDDGTTQVEFTFERTGGESENEYTDSSDEDDDADDDDAYNEEGYKIVATTESKIDSTEDNNTNMSTTPSLIGTFGLAYQIRAKGDIKVEKVEAVELHSEDILLEDDKVDEIKQAMEGFQLSLPTGFSVEQLDAVIMDVLSKHEEGQNDQKE
eukprot:m.55721 g.55721  ORF g.55721 m.55721 type:complete len:190 (+) comp7766_c3_seq1:153-722(+)